MTKTMTDPPAPDLGALRERLGAHSMRWSASRGTMLAEISPRDLDTLLDAYDAQAARLAAVEPVVEAALPLSAVLRYYSQRGDVAYGVYFATGPVERFLIAVDAARAVGAGEATDE